MNFGKVEIDLLFETSWEVCNKVGGIYTVLSTKARNLTKLYGDKVIFIGPDVWSETNPCTVFEESESLLSEWRDNTKLLDGVSVRVGRWKVPGNPIAVLVGFDGMYRVKDSFYGEMWRKFGVDSLHAYGDYDEACAFSHASALVIESLIKTLCPAKDSRIIAHFDEWTTGMGLLCLKAAMPNVATIFTTHATSIGRSICGNGKDLYRYFNGYNGDQMARELNMESKHSLEKAAAHNADCFTTVSDITAEECEQLLEIRPNVVTPNGFESDFVPSPRLFNGRRKAARATLLKVAACLTGDLPEDAFIVATSGRCEYRNKGLDLFIDSIHKLGENTPNRTVVAYIMVPAWLKQPRLELKENLSLNNRKKLDQPFFTHEVFNPEDDAVMRHIKNSNICEQTSGKVRIIYVPCYLNGNDGIFDMSYYDLLIGVDATVFPSYYEPWGYTPLESIAFGVPTITTSLSGFGRWILSNFENDITKTGVYVVPRDDSNYFEARDKIAYTLSALMELKPKAKSAVCSASKETAQKAAWDYFIEYYIEAFRTALENAKNRNKSKSE